MLHRVSVPGLGWAGLGVLAFSGTVPATVFALRGLDPLLVGAGRSVLAAGLAAVCLALARARRPSRGDWAPLLVVAAGCGVGFGVLSAIALARVSASHAAVVIGLLPAATAIHAVVRTGERASPLFWLSSLSGAAVVVGYALFEGTGALQGADLLLLAALVVGAAGYAEGGRLARRMPGWQVIAWAVLLATPVCVPLSAVALRTTAVHVSLVTIAGLAYVSVVSMFLGFFAWFRGLATAGVARASQLQLFQPVLTVAWSALLLGDRPGAPTLVTAAAVLLCVAGSQRSRFSPVSPAAPAAPPEAPAVVHAG